MYYVKATAAAIGPGGHTPFDVERRTRLPADKYRPIGRTLDSRWARLAREGSVTIIEADTIVPAGDAIPKAPGLYIKEDEIEGYEPPTAPSSQPVTMRSAGTSVGSIAGAIANTSEPAKE